jgi:hypothetical protein
MYIPSAKDTQNLVYLNTSKDGKRYVYKYILPNISKGSTDIKTVYKLFIGETIKITDSEGKAIIPSDFLTKKPKVVYIKQKIQ